MEALIQVVHPMDIFRHQLRGRFIVRKVRASLKAPMIAGT